MKHIQLKQIEELNNTQWEKVLQTVKQSKINLHYFDKKFKGSIHDLKKEWLEYEIIEKDEYSLWGKKYYVLLLKDKVIGVVCFDRQDNDAEIIVAINRRQRKKGFGKILVLMAECQFVKDYDITHIVADIYDNEASLKLFLSCGYLSNGIEYIKWFSYNSFKAK
jgi:hypothetical protein